MLTNASVNLTLQKIYFCFETLGGTNTVQCHGSHFSKKTILVNWAIFDHCVFMKPSQKYVTVCSTIFILVYSARFRPLCVFLSYTQCPSLEIVNSQGKQSNYYKEKGCQIQTTWLVGVKTRMTLQFLEFFFGNKICLVYKDHHAFLAWY